MSLRLNTYCYRMLFVLVNSSTEITFLWSSADYIAVSWHGPYRRSPREPHAGWGADTLIENEGMHHRLHKTEQQAWLTDVKRQLIAFYYYIQGLSLQVHSLSKRRLMLLTTDSPIPVQCTHKYNILAFLWQAGSVARLRFVTSWCSISSSSSKS